MIHSPWIWNKPTDGILRYFLKNNWNFFPPETESIKSRSFVKSYTCLPLNFSFFLFSSLTFLLFCFVFQILTLWFHRHWFFILSISFLIFFYYFITVRMAKLSIFRSFYSEIITNFFPIPTGGKKLIREITHWIWLSAP